MTAELITLQDALAGEYSIERELGRGGMGIVFLAREVQLDRLVAIKVLPHALASRDDVRERFMREAKTAARLTHPNIVAIHRVGQAGELPYFVMTFVEGQTLGERFRDRGPVPSRVLTGILRDVALAIAYAHGRGVVHRDIKPDNILLEGDGGRAMVTDFGIAATVADLDESEPQAGTVHFMSPEQLLGERIDGRSDLYSLGLVGYLTLTGTLPHEDGDVTALVRRRVSEPAPPVGQLATDAPTSLTAVIDRCVARERDDRFPDAETVASTLNDAGRVTRPALPLVLRSWASTPVPLGTLYALWSLVSGISAVGSLAGGDLGQAATSLLFAMLPAIPMAIFEGTQTRRVLRAGYTLRDLQHALRAWRAERLEELQFHEEQRETWFGVILRRIIPVSIAALGITAGALWWTFIGSSDAVVSADLVQMLSTISGIATFAGIGSAVLMTALGVPILPPGPRRRLLGRFRIRFWNSPIASWVIQRLAPGRRDLAAGGFRPTELVLELALDDLFATLPQSYRAHLDELPATVRRLTQRATELRQLLTELEERGADASIRQSTGEARARLGDVVAALERIRLGLMRLHGGMTDLRPLTTALDAARVLAGDVDRLADAQREVGGVQRPRVDPTRVPSPA